MNDENIENITFDQVRKILKERNLRGSIKLLVKTYEGKITNYFIILKSVIFYTSLKSHQYF
jgi:hypothetical protein